MSPQPAPGALAPENVDRIRARLEETELRDRVARDPSARFDTADEMTGRSLDREDLQAEWNDAGVEVATPARPEQSFLTLLAVAAVIVVAIVVGAVMFA